MLLIGNSKLMHDQGVEASGLEGRATELASGGKTPMYVAVNAVLLRNVEREPSASAPQPPEGTKRVAPAV